VCSQTIKIFVLISDTPSVQPTTSRDSSHQGKTGTSQTDLSFENDQLKLIVVKAAHLQERKFRLEDHMFHLKLIPKNNGPMPLLSNILKFLHLAFLFILNNIKQFYNPQDTNIMFMTLIQTPMLNAINTGGFLLHDSTSPNEMVDRLLSLLNQYLISNKSLQLNKTFKVYLKILSASHSTLTKPNKKLLRKKRKHFGNPNSEKILRALWAIDVPQIFDQFKDRCLLLSIVLGLAQHDYYISNFKDKRFKYMQYILSKHEKSVKYAANLYNRRA